MIKTIILPYYDGSVEIFRDEIVDYSLGIDEYDIKERIKDRVEYKKYNLYLNVEYKGKGQITRAIIYSSDDKEELLSIAKYLMCYIDEILNLLVVDFIEALKIARETYISNKKESQCNGINN